ECRVRAGFARDGAVDEARRPSGDRQGTQQVGVEGEPGCVLPTAQRAQRPHEQEVVLQPRLVLGEAVGGLDHGVRGREARVVARDVTAVGAEHLGLLHDVEAAPDVALHVDDHERLEPRAEPRARAPHALRNGAQLAVLPAQHRDDAVGLTQLVGAQHDGFVTVNRHAPLCPAGLTSGRMSAATRAFGQDGRMAPDTAVATFESVRPRLFGIAYRMMGTVAEAEDLVQEAWLRWQGTDHESVREPAAFLATTVTRLALTELDSARARRERYVGSWLPEPVDTSADPALGAERAEALSFAVLLLLERLTPPERAAYVLHEAFDYPYRRIAEVLETSEANARQWGSRARAHLERARTASVTDAQRERLLAA